MLEPWERRQLTRLLFMLPATWVALRVLGFNRTRLMAELEITANQTEIKRQAMSYAQRCAELAAIATRNGLYQANCLHQSLALCRVLRQHGLDARLRVGVMPDSRPFKAHAWVEFEGVPLGQAVEEYTPFQRFDIANGPPDSCVKS